MVELKEGRVSRSRARRRRAPQTFGVGPRSNAP